MTARTRSASTAAGATIRLVTFGVSDAWYAADIAFVERVLRREGVHPVPNMPTWMDGVLEHHGRFVPVIDLCQRFALPGAAPSTPVTAHAATAHAGDAHRHPAAGGTQGRLLLLSSGQEVVAAAVDRVVDVRAVQLTDIAPPPALVRGVTGEFITGMVRRDQQVVYILDIAKLLSPDEHRALDGYRVEPSDRALSPS
ncbi:MAG: chemotaxis protein CheW [Gemmatimonadaceae bacterium]|nr:chemotaxis protein CheW [Gemmatimonadaceae bacterium]